MKKTIIAASCVLAILLALAGAGVWWFQARSLPRSFTESAVRVIGHEASRMFDRDPATSQDEIDRMIQFQHKASNINLKLDADGRAVDPFGTAFRVQHRVGSGKSITTVTSAGPDREFETEDDIQFVHTRDVVAANNP